MCEMSRLISLHAWAPARRMQKTRRGEERVCAALAVRLGNAAGTTRNVSASGIFVVTDASYGLGDKVGFSVPLGRSLVLKGRGEVVRIEQGSGKAGIAIRITQSTLERDAEGSAGAAEAEAHQVKSVTQDTRS